ncbi:MAG: hypothetical protein N3E49_06680 [Bacteroidia bacterium]|nr:hypothetical protein [Bacteroidia bacterium]
MTAFFFASGCASIHPPDGGDMDVDPPALRSVSRLRKGRRLRLRWDEYLSPASQLTGPGLWMNPSLPFRASLRGKKIDIRLDSLPIEDCVSLWGGPGLKDFTENNPLPPTLLWSSCPVESLFIAVPLQEANDKAVIWADFHRGRHVYRFAGWRKHLYVAGLPPGVYEAWAWEDQDNDGRWSLSEPVWLPQQPLQVPPPDTLSPSEKDGGRTFEFGPQEAFLLQSIHLPPWYRWRADTLPPVAPRFQVPDSATILMFFTEPVFLRGGEAFHLSETVLQTKPHNLLIVADSAGYTDTIVANLDKIDTQAYTPRVFWFSAVNARTPYIYLRWIDTMAVLDTFWVGRKGDSLFLADACFLPGEVWLSPLPTEGEVETFLCTSAGDTIPLKLPARKHPVSLPSDSLVVHWRLYGAAPYTGGSVIPALSGELLWLPAGTYSYLGVQQSMPFWRPVEIREGHPRLYALPATSLRTLLVRDELSSK